MWTKERLVAQMADAPRLCVLLLRADTDGAWLCLTLTENGGEVPCRKAQNEKAAVRRMAEICRKSADGADRVTIAHAEDVLHAAQLAGELGQNTSFEPLDPALGSLALLYAGSLRSSPPV
ncbi:MAG: hypothetical protein IKW76_04490 [Clostridia bacterium]|nr:hypothetical protein [Clostridia bacterium]